MNCIACRVEIAEGVEEVDPHIEVRCAQCAAVMDERRRIVELLRTPEVRERIINALMTTGGFVWSKGMVAGAIDAVIAAIEMPGDAPPGQEPIE